MSTHLLLQGIKVIHSLVKVLYTLSVSKSENYKIVQNAFPLTPCCLSRSDGLKQPGRKMIHVTHKLIKEDRLYEVRKLCHLQTVFIPTIII